MSACFTYRVKPSIDQFIAGMDSVGQFFTDYLKKWPQVFLPLFVDTGEQLTVNKFRGHYAVIWSGEGSNRRSEEQDTIYCFDQYLVKVSLLLHAIVTKEIMYSIHMFEVDHSKKG